MTTTQARQSVSAKLKGLELPDAFAQATSASYARILAKKRSERTAANVRDARRLARQESRIARGV